MIKNRNFLLPGAMVPAVLMFLSACAAKELPPDPGTPEPAAHDGVFACEYGTMTFKGDGESITFDLVQEFAEAAGLPTGIRSGSYVFLFQHGQWRYDKADRFRITAADTSCDFINDFTVTDERTIALLSPIDGKETLLFIKEDD